MLVGGCVVLKREEYWHVCGLPMTSNPILLCDRSKEVNTTSSFNACASDTTSWVCNPLLGNDKARNMLGLQTGMVGGRERKKHVGESGDLEEWEIGRLVRMGVKRECNTWGRLKEWV